MANFLFRKFEFYKDVVCIVISTMRGTRFLQLLIKINNIFLGEFEEIPFWPDGVNHPFKVDSPIDIKMRPHIMYVG